MPPQMPAASSLPAAAAPAPRGRRSAVLAAVGSFVLGGAVGIGGFAVGQRTAEDSPAVEPTVVTTLAPVPDASERSSGQNAGTTPAAPQLSGDEPIAVVASAVGPSVVQVETARGQGSGVVYDDGLILTNHHVIEDAGDQVQIRTDDGRVFAVEVLGSDPRNDIAVLSAPGSDLPVAAIGSSAELEVGQLTVAIGSPFQLQQTVTSGIVSSLNRPVPNQADSLSAMIQTDAPINPGNSGGALANRAGEVVGINASIRTDGTSNTNVGIGFAIPIDTAIDVAARIVSGQSLEPGVLGVTGENGDEGIGVPIAEVSAGSAAEAAGLQPGDRVLTIDGAPVTNIGEVVGLVQSNFGGDTVELQILRDGVNLEVQATLD